MTPGRQLRWLGSCGWCGGPLSATRADAVYCSKSCRQAAHRARIGRAELEATDGPLRLAYADPPYPGRAHLYRDHPDYAGEVDHAELLARLAMYDGWALSTSAEALPYVLGVLGALQTASRGARRRGLAPNKVRVAPWIRGPRPHATARLLTSWEAVIFLPARCGSRGAGETPTLDSLVGPTPRRRSTLPSAVIGAKPPEFCAWLFRLLGARIGDELDDLYPGSGIVGRSWLWYQGRDPGRLPTSGATRRPGLALLSGDFDHETARTAAERDDDAGVADISAATARARAAGLRLAPGQQSS